MKELKERIENLIMEKNIEELRKMYSDVELMKYEVSKVQMEEIRKAKSIYLDVDDEDWDENDVRYDEVYKLSNQECKKANDKAQAMYKEIDELLDEIAIAIGLYN